MYFTYFFFFRRNLFGRINLKLIEKQEKLWEGVWGNASPQQFL